MVTISLNTAKTLLITFGPLLLPRVLGLYRSIRRPNSPTTPSVRPCPPALSRSLNILFASAVISIISTLPKFMPENIFIVTNSRLQIPTDVLFTRLANFRTLTPSDDSLRARLVSLESRLLYFQYGPSPLAECRFCSSDNPLSFLYYALPSLLTPHLLHVILIGIATSSLVGGKPAARFRIFFTSVAIAIAAIEVYAVVSYNHKLNLSSTRLYEIDFFHWNVKLYRGIGLAVVDVLLAAILWAAGTNRILVKPLSQSERLEAASKKLERANGKLHALGVARNVVCRDKALRETMEEYWIREGRVIGEVFEEREVLDGVNAAVGKLDLPAIQKEAGAFAEKITLKGGEGFNQ